MLLIEERVPIICVYTTITAIRIPLRHRLDHMTMQVLFFEPSSKNVTGVGN